MTETTLRRVLAAVAVLAVGYGAVVLIGGSDEGDGPGGPVVEAMARAAGALDSVRIEGGGDTVALRRVDGGWRVDGHPADTARVGSLERALGAEASSVELASRNPENHAGMGVDSASARRVVLSPAGGEPVRLLVGDEGPGGSGVYVRTPESASVYLVPGDLGRLARQDRQRWRDRTVTAVDTGRARTIRVRRGDTAYALRRGDGAWRLDGGPADSARVDRLLSDLAGLEADGFAPDTATVEPADRSVTVLGSGASDTLTRVLMRRTGGDDRSRYHARVRGRPGVLELSAARADRLAPPRADLAPDGGAGGPGSGDGSGAGEG